MLLKRYVIDIRHGDKEHPCTCTYAIEISHGDTEHPCTCTEEEMAEFCDRLPDREIVRNLVEFLVWGVSPSLKDTPIASTGEKE